MFSNNPYYNSNDLMGHNEAHTHYYHQGPTNSSMDRYLLHLRMKEQENRVAEYRRRSELRERQLFEHWQRQAIVEREEELRQWKRHQELMRYCHEQEEEKDDDYDIDIVHGQDAHDEELLGFGRGDAEKNSVSDNTQTQKPPLATPSSPPAIDTKKKRWRMTRPWKKKHEDLVEDDIDVASPQKKSEPKVPPAVSKESVSNDEAIVDEAPPGLRSRVTAPYTQQHQQQQQQQRRRRRMPHSRMRRNTVIVEDASDSECEDDFDSPWRNRRPSPGQWIEPIEPYYE